MQQKDLFTITPKVQVGNKDIPLSVVTQRFLNKEWLLPVFQREPVWDRNKIKDWIVTIINQDAIGCIVTYQLLSGGPIFLLDGLQRITATIHFIDDPQVYFPEIGNEQARLFCDAFDITAQHRTYKDHVQALVAFQNINKGTSLTPMEFHKGSLVLDTRGETIYNTIPDLVMALQNPFLSGRKISRSNQSRMTRDALALFFQFISGYKKRDFWGVATNSVQNNSNTVERLLLEWMNNHTWSAQHLNNQINLFKKCLSSEIATLNSVISDTDQTGKKFSPTFFRWLLHLAIWRRNNKRPVNLYVDFLKRLLTFLKPYPSLSAKFPLPNSDPVEFCVCSISNLRELPRLCENLDISSLMQQPLRTKKVETAIGYDESHIEPFSKHGDGPTIIEPSSINRARGAQRIE